MMADLDEEVAELFLMEEEVIYAYFVLTQWHQVYCHFEFWRWHIIVYLV